MDILVDSNVILDIATEDKKWFRWSYETLTSCADNCVLVVNPIIYAEVSMGFKNIEDMEEVFPSQYYRRDNLPWEAAFLAGKCFLEYKKDGGKERSPLPDFYIGAHAAVTGMSLLTRIASRYTTYFPKLQLISPESSSAKRYKSVLPVTKGGRE